jgi:hypothetical protein
MITTFLLWLLTLDRFVKRAIQVIFDLVSVVFAGLVMAIFSPSLSDVKIRGSCQFLGSFFNADVSRRDHMLVYLVREFDIPTGENISPEIEEHGFFSRLKLPEATTPGTRRWIEECFDSRLVESVW